MGQRWRRQTETERCRCDADGFRGSLALQAARSRGGLAPVKSPPQVPRSPEECTCARAWVRLCAAAAEGPVRVVWNEMRSLPVGYFGITWLLL